MSAYGQQLKVLADQLAYIGSPVHNERLVLQLLSRLNEQYEGIATTIQQQDSLPTFYDARSKLIMVESCKAEQAFHTAQDVGTTLNANVSRPPQNAHASNDYRNDR
ncbi:uncharacterized protein LOC118485772 [Helianthus annuus]|uniref:uncharacterized protein LOC118485772 n=1 Tax=Helianthus annuus TaxID=4232 RepID=UPI001652DB0A|nr:uncharacterized protein LOC118485772 [Helianthus annuus]